MQLSRQREGLGGRKEKRREGLGGREEGTLCKHSESSAPRKNGQLWMLLLARAPMLQILASGSIPSPCPILISFPRFPASSPAFPFQISGTRECWQKNPKVQRLSRSWKHQGKKSRKQKQQVRKRKGYLASKYRTFKSSSIDIDARN